MDRVITTITGELGTVQNKGYSADRRVDFNDFNIASAAMPNVTRSLLVTSGPGLGRNALRTCAEHSDLALPDTALPQPETDDARRALIMLVRDAGTVIAAADADTTARRAAVNNVLDALLQTVRSTEYGGGLSGHVAVADQWIRYRLQETITTADIAEPSESASGPSS